MKTARTAAVLLASSLLVAFGFNQLLIPHRLISGGVSGITMIVGYATGLNIGFLYLLLNLPILIWGWRVLGRRFIVWSVFVVLATTAAMQLIPERPAVGDLMIASVFGGVAVGLGTGLSLRAGASTGGFDIVASIVSRSRNLPVGMLIFALNGSIIALLGVQTGNWDIALYSLVSIYAAGKIIDLVHISQIKVTAFIITSRTEELRCALLPLQRGITVIRTQGAYTGIERDMLMTVTTRYELAELRRIIKATDPAAFVNIVETAGVMGEFRRPAD
ncbi:YitT family protein [Paenibacillus humicola]|uniref:YitT family protein n=1 Tax=Paenibacillus humicola TaxID=3110540 RepID=UPI00237A97CB|nr:YitT family protein [Paenibacillus humicola]